jgi:parallel beta-helix repeat protein
MVRVVCFVVLVLWSPVASWAITYYAAPAGSGACTTNASGGSSFTTGLGCLSAGDTLYLKAGTYSFSPPNFPSGNSTQGITIASAPGETAVLMPNYGGAGQGALMDVNASYLTFDRLVVDGTTFCQDGANNLFKLQTSSHHIRITNSILRNCQGHGQAGENPVGGTKGVLTTTSTHHNEFLNTEIHHNSGYGIYMNSSDNLVDGCNIHDNDRFGLHLYDDNSANVQRNTVRNTRIWNNGPNSTCPFSCAECGGCNQSGMVMIGADHKVYNNLIYTNAGGGIQMQSSSTLIANNTIYGNHNDACIFGGGSGEARNNICANNAGGNGIGMSGTLTTNLTTDPGFVNPGAGDFHLTAGASTAIDKGTSLSSVFTNDFGGTARPQGTQWDIGAYEFVSAAPPVCPANCTCTQVAGQCDPLAQGGTTYYASTGGSGGCSTNRNAPSSFSTGIGCLHAGDALYLRQGTYNVGGGLDNPPAGTPSARVTITGDPQDPPKSVTIVPHTSGNGVLLEHTSYVTFNNLRIDCTGTDNSCVKIAVDGHHIRFSNGEIFSQIGVGHSCVLISEGSGASEFLNMDIHHCGSNQLDHGFYFAAPNNLVENSRIYNNWCNGIQLYSGDARRSSNNILRNNKWFSNNIGVPCSAIVAGSGDNNLVYNNLAYNNGSGIQVRNGGNNNQVYNNTIVNNTGGDSGGGCLMNHADQTNTVIRNNICYQNQDNSIQGNTSGAIDHNLFASSNPGFVNSAAGDFHLTSSATGAINQGVSISSVFTTDFDNNTRPIGSAWDIGAYEFGGSGQPTGVFYVNTNGGVDANPCTPNSPNTAKKTIANAIANCIRTPGDTLYIRSGVYNERLSGLSWPSGTSFTVPITIAGFAGETATIKAPAGGSGGMVNVTNTSYLIFDNLTLDATDYATDSSHHALVLGTGTHHIRVQNSHIQSARGFTSPNASKGIVIDPSSTNNELLGLDVHHHLGDGIDIPSANNLVQGSNLHDNARSGLRLSSGGSATANTIRANRLYTNGDNSINCAGGCSYPGLAIDSGTQTLVANNLVYQNANGGMLLAGTNQTVYNNTVANNLSTGACIGGVGTSHTIRNNICWQNGAAITAPGAVAPNLIDIDPLFVNAPGGDFHLFVSTGGAPSSPAIDQGATIAAVTNDVYGTPRPQPPGGAYDIGAVEQSVVPVAGLLGYWPFDAGTGTTAADATGNGHTLTLNGGATWGAGKIGASSLSLSGNAQYATMAIPFQITQYTWAMWVNFTNAPLTTQYQVCFTYGGGADQLSFTWSQPTVGRQKGAIHRDTNGVYQIAAIPDTMTANTWYHIAGTYDGSALRVYMNGLLKATTTVGAMFPGGSGDFRIGQFGTEGCPGLVDEFRWYDRALDQTAIQALASGTGTSTPLVVRHRALVR